MADLKVYIPNEEFRRLVVDAYAHESYEAIAHLIIDLVEEIAGETDQLRDLIEVIQSYIGEEE